MKAEERNIFISDCGYYVAVRIPGPLNRTTYDVWRHDGSEMWVDNRYVKAPGGNGYNPQRLYTEEFAKSRKIIGSWTNCGHRKQNGEWVEGFRLTFVDLDTNEAITAEFHTPLLSLAPGYKRRRMMKRGQIEKVLQNRR